jgi:MFS family permease
MAADLTRGLLALGMLLVRSADQIWLLYILSGLLIAFASFFGPALSAAIPNLVEKNELVSANGLSASTWGLMLAVGAAVGGVVIAAVGRDTAFVINSLSFFFSAFMIFTIHKRFGQKIVHQHPASLGSTLREFSASLDFLRGHPQVTASVLVKTGLGLTAGIILLLTIFAQAIFAAGDSGIGWLYSARGLGVLLGPLLARPWVGHDLGKMRRAILVSFFVGAAGYMAFSGAPFFWLAALFVVVGHIGTGTLWTLSSTMLQLLVPDHLRGRIFAIDFGMNTVTSALSTFLVGIAVEGSDARSVALAMGVVFVVYALVWGGLVLASQRRNSEAWGNAPGEVELSISGK